MRSFFTLIAGTAIAALSGCASSPGDVQIRASVAGANAEIARAQAKQLETPLVELKFNTNGQIESLVVGRPDASAAQYVQTPDDPRMRVASEAVSGLRSVVGIAAGAWGAGYIIDKTGDVVSKTLQYQPKPVVVQPPAYNEPVVVNQPAPVVVQPPAYNDPIVVTQPEPIIVPAGETVIVEPTIINR